MPYRTDYAGHDRRYQALRASGALGWDGPEDYAEHFRSLEQSFASADAPPPGRVLELGCGAGNVSRWLAARGWTVVGIDVAATALAWAHEQGGGPRYVLADACTLGCFGDATFDAVIDSHCLHCLIGVDRATCLRAVARVLRPGGWLRVHTMCGPIQSPRLLAQFDAEARVLTTGDLATRTIADPDQVVAEVEQAGLRVVARDVEARVDRDDLDMLRLHAVKPARSER